MIVGIDFGTCFSSAAIMNGFIPVTSYVKDTTGVGIPSLFMHSKEQNKDLFGEDCVTGEAFRHSSDVIRNMKRLVREDPENISMKVSSGGNDYALSDVIRMYLSYLIEEIKKGAEKSGEYSSTDIDAITITAPVGIAQGQMMATDYNQFLQDTVMGITGLPKEKVRVIQEPVAAAISYLYSEDVRKEYSEKQRIMVFDLGGGTLDVTIMEHDPDAMTYEILAKEGDLNLGGNNWDELLAKAVMKKLGLGSFRDSDEEATFMRAVTKLKIDLTQSEDSMIFFTYDGEDKFTRFSRREFDEATFDLLNRSMETVEDALDNYGCSVDELDKIVLVGGSSNMPQIKAGLMNEFPEFDSMNIMVYDPSKAIAKGAALYAKLNCESGRAAEGAKIVDICTNTYGFDSMYHGIEDCVYNMIYKGMPFDDDGSIRVMSDTSFIPLRDSQTSVSFVIFESSSSKGEGFDGNWFHRGNGETENGMEVTVQVPKAYYGRATQFHMWAEFALDTNGILELIVTDPEGNRLGFTSSTVKGYMGRR